MSQYYLQTWPSFALSSAITSLWPQTKLLKLRQVYHLVFLSQTQGYDLSSKGHGVNWTLVWSLKNVFGLDKMSSLILIMVLKYLGKLAEPL